MAGLGRKIFTRERATISDVQGYLMDQAVMAFASAAARAAQIPDPDDGMHSYLRDVKRMEVFDEAAGAWICREPQGPLIAAFATSAFTTDGTSTEQRVVGALNVGVPLTAGRLYRATARGRLSAGNAGAVGHLTVRGARGAGATVTNTSTCVASDRKVHSQAGSSGSQDAVSAGEFTVAVTDTYALSPFLQVNTGTLTLFTNVRGRSDVLIEDIGPAIPDVISL